MKKTISLILAIILLAFILRFYKVTEIPPSLNWDEVSIAYNAYSILKTGKDEWGQPFPLHFKAYGEYKLPAQIYASTVGIWIFGLNELGVRITPIVYGTLTVVLVFFLGRAIFANSTTGLAAAFLLAISPWHIHLTRASFESSFALLWVTLGVWWFVKGFKDSKWIMFSMIPFALSVYTYNSARTFVPLFLLVLAIIYRRELVRYKKKAIGAAVTFFILMLPLIPFVLSGEGGARYKLVSVFDDPGFVLRINESRGNSNFPYPISKLIHNKITHGTLVLSRNYLSHFTPDFLFINGAPHKQHHVQKIGQLYSFQAPFLLFGLYLLFKNLHPFRFLLISWLLLAFVPVSVTQDSIPHGLRTLIAVPVYQLITAFGFWELIRRLNLKSLQIKLLASTSIILIILFSLAYYLKIYYQEYSTAYSRDWQYGYKQVVEFVSQRKDNYDLIVFSRHYGEPHMFTLFFAKYDPAKFQNDPNLIRFETFDWVRVLRFDKYYFPDLGDEGTRFKNIVEENKGKKILFVGKLGDFPDEIKKLYQVNFLNGQPAFEIIEIL